MDASPADTGTGARRSGLCFVRAGDRRLPAHPVSGRRGRGGVGAGVGSCATPFALSRRWRCSATTRCCCLCGSGWVQLPTLAGASPMWMECRSLLHGEVERHFERHAQRHDQTYYEDDCDRYSRAAFHHGLLAALEHRADTLLGHSRPRGHLPRPRLPAASHPSLARRSKNAGSFPDGGGRLSAPPLTRASPDRSDGWPSHCPWTAPRERRTPMTTPRLGQGGEGAPQRVHRRSGGLKKDRRRTGGPAHYLFRRMPWRGPTCWPRRQPYKV